MALKSIWVVLLLGLVSCSRGNQKQDASETAAQIEICDNKADEDNDGKIDCFDSDCRFQEICKSLACADHSLNSNLGPQLFSGETSGQGLYKSSCGGSTAPEAAFLWQAPHDGVYLFSTKGSEFDTILTVFDHDCLGQELACNDDSITHTSEIKLQLKVNQTVVVMIDGRSSSQGKYVLNIENFVEPQDAEPTAEICTDGIDNDLDTFTDCEDSECLSNAQCKNIGCPFAEYSLENSTGSIAEGEQRLEGSCGGKGHERTFLWTAPEDGVYTFNTNGSTFKTTLYLLDATCAGQELLCGKANPQGDQPTLAKAFTQGQTVIVVVDSEANAVGNFTLSIWADRPLELCNDTIDNDLDNAIDCADSDCTLQQSCLAETCPNADIGSLLGENIVEGVTRGESERFGECGGEYGPERTYLWTAPESGWYTFVGHGPSSEIILYLLDASCSGQEVACSSENTPLTQAYVEQGQSLVVVVDTYPWFSDETQFSLSITASERGLCSDGIDNDGDNALDCDDTDCLVEAQCEPTCPDRDLGSALGDEVFMGSTVRYPNEFRGTCGSSSSERTFIWTAPETGYYRFDTSNSEMDTALYAFDASCNAQSELACNNDATDNDTYSSIQVPMTQGQSIVLVVDGYYDEGEFTLNIHPSETGSCDDGIDNDGDEHLDCGDKDCRTDSACCPMIALPSRYGSMLSSGGTNNFNNLVRGSCGGSGKEQMFLWTPPVAGRYVINTNGSGFDSVLYVRNAACDGTELTCDDDSGDGSNSQVTVNLTAQQTIVIVVDSFSSFISGNYQLNIEALELSVETGLCDDGVDNDDDAFLDCADIDCVTAENCQSISCVEAIDLQSALGEAVVIGNTTDGEDRREGYCGGINAPEQMFIWQAPRAGLYTFATDPNLTTFDTVVYLLDSSCESNGLACDDNEGATLQSSARAYLAAGQSIVIVVDGYEWSSGEFALNITQQQLTTEQNLCSDGIDNDNDGQKDCSDTDCNNSPQCPSQGCADFNLGSTLGDYAAVNQTNNQGDNSYSACGGADTEDVSYAFVAPEDGLYFFDTLGSAFDTVLYIQNAECGMYALKCDDNEGMSAQSMLFMQLNAGDPIVIVVDGAYHAKGTFVLNIHKQ